MPRLKIMELDSTEKGIGADMGLYFNHTYLKVSADGVKPPVWAKYGGYHSGKGHIFQQDSDTIYVPANDPKAFVEWMYPTGWFNTKDSALYCERHPRRQYLKGLNNTGNFKFNTAEAIAKEKGMFLAKGNEELEEILDSLHGTHVPATISQIKAVFDSVGHYPSFAESYVKLKEKSAFSRALNHDVCMMLHPQTKDLVVFCHDFPVGELLTKNKLKMLLPEFKAECLSYFTKEGVSVV